jgi:molecular chaperone DnaK (HSP70)
MVIGIANERPYIVIKTKDMGDKRLAPEEIESDLIQHMLAQACAATKSVVRNIVVTVPGKYQDQKTSLLLLILFISSVYAYHRNQKNEGDDREIWSYMSSRYC